MQAQNQVLSDAPTREMKRSIPHLRRATRPGCSSLCKPQIATIAPPRIVTPVDTRFRLATVRHSRVNMADFRGSEAELPVSEAMRMSGNFRRLRKRVLGSQLAWKFAVSMKFPPFPGVVLEEQK
jgi:hypothetical protein